MLNLLVHGKRIYISAVKNLPMDLKILHLCKENHKSLPTMAPFTEWLHWILMLMAIKKFMILIADNI